jgi:hypothetical protein
MDVFPREPTRLSGDRDDHGGPACGGLVGFIQAGVMIAGFCAAMAYGLMYLSAVYKYVLDGRATEAQWKAMQPAGWIGIAGFALCGLAWFWALFSSFQILNESRRHQSL